MNGADHGDLYAFPFQVLCELNITGIRSLFPLLYPFGRHILLSVNNVMQFEFTE
jgi:hypothetical protein